MIPPEYALAAEWPEGDPIWLLMTRRPLVIASPDNNHFSCWSPTPYDEVRPHENEIVPAMVRWWCETDGHDLSELIKWGWGFSDSQEVPDFLTFHTSKGEEFILETSNPRFWKADQFEVHWCREWGGYPPDEAAIQVVHRYRRDYKRREALIDD